MKLSLLAYALSAVGRRKARSFALGGGLAFAVALIAAVLFLTESLRAEAERARAAQLDWQGALDRFRAAQELTLHGSGPRDNIEASIIDARAREMQSLLREDRLQR